MICLVWTTAKVPTSLHLDEDEGLAEAIHLMLFPNGIVVAEVFGHGPRATRFPLYLKGKLDMACTMRAVVRHDVVEEALKYTDIRLVRFQLNPSDGSHVAAAAETLHGVMDTAQSLSTGVWAELALRSDKGDRAFTSRIKKMLENVFGGRGSVAEAFNKLEKCQGRL
jgi:hypothetical protein